MSQLDMSDTIAPKSDQLVAVDLLGGPRVFTIENVSKNNGDQPFNLHLAEFPRPWRPGLSMRRVLVACWGKDAAQYVGRRVRLWCDPEVRFGGQAVGGIRITHLSHIDSAKTTPLLVTRGKSAMYKVEPLPDDAPPAVDPLTAAKRRVAAAAPKGVDLKTWVPAALDARGLGDGIEDLIKLAEELEAQ